MPVLNKILCAILSLTLVTYVVVSFSKKKITLYIIITSILGVPKSNQHFDFRIHFILLRKKC